MLLNTSLFLFLCIVPSVLSIRCYQCASSQGRAHMKQHEYEDTCGAYKKFDKESHIAVECGSDESHTPGSFCMKLTQQGPKGFIWDGRWRQVVRRCASVAENGVTGVCNWGVYENGVYWEECYCSSDECNASNMLIGSLSLIIGAFGFMLYYYKLI